MAPSTVEDVTIRVLGGFRVECGGMELPAERWSRPSARRLLKALALAEGGRLHRIRLGALLWPDADRDAAARSLRVALHAVRRALEPDLSARAASSYLVSCVDGSVALSPDRVRVDLAAAREAVSDDRATPDGLVQVARSLLPELLPDDDHEGFVRTARRAHRELRRRGAVATARADRATGVVTGLLSEVLQVDPLAADVCQALLECLLAAGRPEEAVRQYHAYREALLNACATEPDRPLRELFAQALAAPVAPPRTLRVVADESPFMGRDAELALLTAVPGPAAPRVVALTGEPGIGLSRTLAEAAARLRGRRIHVLHTRGDGPEFGGPYGAVLAPIDDFVGRLAPRARAAVAGAHPGVASVLTSLYGSMERAGEASPADICAFVADLAEHRPVVLFVDDLERAAPQVLRLLRQLARHCAALPVRFVVAYRARDQKLPQVVAEAHRVALGRLTREQCARMAGGGFEGHEIFRLSGGNPLCALYPGRVQQRLEREPQEVGDVVSLLAPHPEGLSLAAISRGVESTQRAHTLAGLEQALRLGWVQGVRGTAGGRLPGRAARRAAGSARCIPRGCRPRGADGSRHAPT
ncbi:AAA family ATPase [Streptomyces sp. NBC_01669]|uniref:AAA family ATPase n=1 Tax=Streptomyces sp. NBC_01669 TaxID=2975909 RepID=UPI00225A5D01|nr:AAA family ATPase [Streptomyces sp. NBC_01669]MCX4537103.1 AAA family ATPase [Streptomyces sp. NBC_01669]